MQRLGPRTVLQGLACGTSPTELYVLLINLEGSYAIIRSDADAGSSDLLAAGKTSAIRGSGQTNRIEAQCSGGPDEAVLTLSVNGVTIAEGRGKKGASFDRTAFEVTTLHAIANSTRSPGLVKGLNTARQPTGSPVTFGAEILFDNVRVVGVPK